jgi:NTP pyrophosphatase (non-canonical NTP hydrolase)
VNIEQLIKKQREFDSAHNGNFNWDEEINDENIELLEYLLICMVGEFGEISNVIKKVVRGDYKLEEVKEHLSEEVIDILIYVIKLAYQLNIDIEQTYEKKMEKNKLRFRKYEKE